MGLKSQYQIRRKQRLKRKDARKKLASKNADLKDYYYGRYYLQAYKSEASS